MGSQGAVGWVARFVLEEMGGLFALFGFLGVRHRHGFRVQAGGFEGVEARGMFTFIAKFHGDIRIVWRAKLGWSKVFRIKTKWVVIDDNGASDLVQFPETGQIEISASSSMV